MTTADVSMLQKTTDGWEGRLRRVKPDQWTAPTPCGDWTVRDLVNHLVAGDEMSPRLLSGATGDEITELFGTDRLGDDPVAAWERSSVAEIAAFAEPGAFERTVHHPGAGDIPGAQYYGFRVMDHTIHAWDLARAIGVEEHLAPDVVEAVWAILEPLRPVITDLGGAFGPGPSGTVPDDAPLQDRLLDLTGRRLDWSPPQ